jgi:hypothetical protein
MTPGHCATDATAVAGKRPPPHIVVSSSPRCSSTAAAGAQVESWLGISVCTFVLVKQYTSTNIDALKVLIQHPMTTEVLSVIALVGPLSTVYTFLFPLH